MYAFNTIFLTELKSHMSEKRQIQEEHSFMGTKNSQKFASLSKCGLAAQMNYYLEGMGSNLVEA